MINFGTRRNLKYPALLVLFNGLRALERHLAESLFKIDNNSNKNYKFLIHNNLSSNYTYYNNIKIYNKQKL